jgi:hypothetical protein
MSDIVEALLAQVGSKPSKPDTPRKPLQTTLQFVSGKPRLAKQADHLRDRVIKTIGSCFRLHDSIVSLFRRINVVYFRK